MKGVPYGCVGAVTGEQTVSVGCKGRRVADLTIPRIRALWSGDDGAAS